ncbi:alpha/beta fold hydrolase [Streptomyces sp. H27-D2]|uniref:alpha/beta fold hydrolase n=1 Tax=Streptomyces sp. H27-D2 TaxID=3046304 RepID=UPI002DBFCA78|nr:alpha/beta fold hydrolase [Streptomyces sp. H27-D2]MEC4020417.1 alpha/beta fold hydrolase [Streptomyces sp. H27-D2]
MKPLDSRARSRHAALFCATAALVTSITPTPPAHAAPTAETPQFTHCPDDVPAPAAPDRIDCATLRVPLDWDRPDGPHLRLAVSRVAATGTAAERRGVLLVNPGGPGGSGLGYAATKRAKLPASVRRSYDVIGFDPRGTGRSSPADCGPMGGLFETPGADPIPPPGTTAPRSPTGTARLPAPLRPLHASLKRTAQDCAQGIGDALPHLNTTNTARDMDAVRAALGEPRISYLGVSYGSYLGAAYTALYPRRVDRMVLDSVVGPESWHAFDLRQATALLGQRDTLFDWLAAHPGRFRLGADRERVRAAYTRARSALAAAPEDGFGPAEFDRAVYRSLGRTERWTALGDGIRDYLDHRAVTALRPAEPFSGQASRTYEAANRAVKCADGPGPTPPRVSAQLRRLLRLDPLPVVTGMEAWSCAYWAHRPAHRTALGSAAPPVLLVASEHDPVTPIAGAHALRRRLPGSRLVTLHDDYSHGVFASRGNACVDGAAGSYLVGGEVPPRDVHCAGPGLPEPSAR